VAIIERGEQSVSIALLVRVAAASDIDGAACSTSCREPDLKAPAA
jgi:hypothetical protein